MWVNRSRRQSPNESVGSNRLNSTMPLLPSSPVVSRRNSINLGLNQTFDSKSLKTPERRNLNGSGTQQGPLSSPFMPQIKRALGLEPSPQPKYSEHRRHSLGIGLLPKSPVVAPGSLPHVRLNKSHRLSLSERNSSMMNRSSTVKIAPPAAGKVASPSLYHLRCNTTPQEERSTPDTYAVISALKERRKRSINTFEEHTEVPVQQAKRRRQESQHSNASTSSMPSLPDNFPELANPDFTLRIETPAIKRPSRPSQQDVEEWVNERDAATKRPRSDGRNNSILSSLSSSQRFLESQRSKRKAETSFSEKENENLVSKTQKKEPPKLTHLDIPTQSNGENSAKTAIVQQVKEKTQPMVNGHSSGSPQKEETTRQSPKTEEASKPATIARMPSMKKTASIYAGLSSSASFKKAQYANVVATLDDYDSDRQAEQQRVKQMLKDLDESFTAKQVKTDVATTVTTTTTATTTTASVSTLAMTSATIPTLATTTTSFSITSSSITSPALSALEKFAKSPIQETGGKPQVSTSTTSSVAFKPLFSSSGSTTAGNFILSTSQPAVSVGSQPSVTSSLTSTPGGFTFNLPKSTQSTGGFPSSTGLLGGIQAQPSTGSGFSFSGTTPLSTATPSSTSSLPKPNGFSFGLSTTSTVQPVSGGFSFGNTPSATATSLPTVPMTASSGVLFGLSASTTTSATPTAVGFGMSTKPTPSTTSAPGGFSFNTQSKNPSLTTGFPFDGTANLGLTSGLSGSFASTGGFPFGGTGSSAASTGLTTGVSGSIVPTTGFSFGSAGSSTSNAGLTTGVQGSKISTTGFSFGGAGSTANTGLTTGVQGSIVPTTGFSFGGAGSSAPSTGLTSSTAATGGFSFGGTGSSSSAKAIGGFSFGPSTTATVMAVAQPLYFQTTTASTGVFGSTAPTSGFAFGSKPTTTSVTSLFGSSPAVTTQSLFATPFGAAATPLSTPFSFGATKTTAQFSINTGSTNTTAGSSAPFSFGVGSTASTTGSSQPASGLFQFGGAPNTAAPAFGTPATQTGSVFGTTGQAPAFGSSSQTPAFGATNPPAFGSSNQTSVFGSANQPPAFGASANQTAFGSATPSFGASTNQTTGFGSATPTFGASATPTFGASANQKPATPAFGGAFGSGGGAGTGFAKSHSMPVFNTVPDSSTNTGTFNFGAPAPNVNPFGQGQVTPAKQTGAAFGQMSNDMTPKAQTGAMFSFGQSNNNSSASKGFDFSASTNPGGAANAGGFNFNATPSGTPGFGSTSSTPGTFAMGSAPPRTNRTMARASRRRPTRK